MGEGVDKYGLGYAPISQERHKKKMREKIQRRKSYDKI